MKIQFIILYVYRIPAQCTVSWFAAVVQWTNKVVGQVAFASEYLCLFLFVQGHPLSQLAFCLMNISISFIHSTEGPHVLPGISTREECYSFPSECGTSAVNTSVSSSFHLIRGTDQFYWLLLSPGNGNSPSWEVPVLCAQAGWSCTTILHTTAPLGGAFSETKDREGKVWHFPFSLDANTLKTQLFSRAPSVASGFSYILQPSFISFFLLSY